MDPCTNIDGTGDVEGASAQFDMAAAFQAKLKLCRWKQHGDTLKVIRMATRGAFQFGGPHSTAKWMAMAFALLGTKWWANHCKSLEVNVCIVTEHQQGFQGLDGKAQTLAGQRMDLLVKKQLDHRKAWLLSVDAARGRAEHRRQRNMPPHSVLKGIGCVAWR